MPRTRSALYAALAAAALAIVAPAPAAADVTAAEIDLRQSAGFAINAPGPMLVRVDAPRDRVVVASTLASALTWIDADSGAVTSVPIGRRALQHLKDACLAIRPSTGEVYLVVDGGFVVADPASGEVVTLDTGVQYESVAVDDRTGNALLAGRESPDLGFYEARRARIRVLRGKARTAAMTNENQTPPPPIRRIVTLPASRPKRSDRIAVVDGLAAELSVHDGRNGRRRSHRALPLEPGGRWHLAGVDPTGTFLYVVTETADRRVIQAAKLAVDGSGDTVVPLPGLEEGVGVVLHPDRDRVYVNYDNHPTMHVVDFAAGGALREIALPAYGNDAVALDAAADRLYVGSWAHGEVAVVDLAGERFLRNLGGLGILPHMFSMDLDVARGRLYFPVGATAVNGCFGAALSQVDVATGEVARIRTAFAPVDLVEAPQRGTVLVAGNDDRLAEIDADGTIRWRTLPDRFPTRMLTGPGGHLYLLYGPHQSYWPVVYIWAARDGLLSLDPVTLEPHDRRLPRQALDAALDDDGRLYLPQNNWGTETQFLSVVEDAVRYPDIRQRIELPDEVTRETTQRILRRDPDTGLLYLVRCGELDEEPSVLQVVDPVTGELRARVELGRTATDLAFDAGHVYVTAFDDDTVACVDKADWSVTTLEVGDGPLRLLRHGDVVFVLNHLGGSLQRIAADGTVSPESPVADGGRPDALIPWGDQLVVVCHGADSMTVRILEAPAAAATHTTLLRIAYPFGDTSFDGANSAFHQRGQYGDAVLTLTRGLVDGQGRLWLADFLSGKVTVLTP